MSEAKRDLESDPDFQFGLSQWSLPTSETAAQALDDEIIARLKSPDSAPLPRLSFQTFLRHLAAGTALAGTVGGAFLLTSLKTPPNPAKSELKPAVGITVPPPVPLDSLMREKQLRAASLWTREDSTTPQAAEVLFPKPKPGVSGAAPSP